MLAILTPEQTEYRTSVRRFVDGVLRPLLEARFDFSRPQTRDDVKELRRLIEPHEIATTAPTRDDGSVDNVCFCIFIEEVARLNVGFSSLAAALFFPVWDLYDLLDERQRLRYDKLFEPGEILALGLSEPDAGSNPSQIETTARRAPGGGWIIDGTKLWTSHGVIASGVTVAAKKIDENGKPVSLFLVDRDEQTYEARPIPTIGMNATQVCEVTFAECWVPPEAEITPGKGGLASALALIEQARLKMAFAGVGIAQAALDLAVAYARVRTQFGRPIGSFQLVQAMLAEMATEIEIARLLGYRAASLYAAKLPARSAMSMAKSYATEMAVRVASTAIKVLGGIGLTKEATAERYLRDARMLTFPDGTTQIHQLIIGRELTGISAFA